MDLRPSQEFSNILWNPKVDYRVHKNLPLVPILSDINPDHTISSYFSKITFNIILLFTTRSSYRSPFFWPSHQKSAWIPLLSYVHYMPSLGFPPWINRANCIRRRVQAMKLHIMHIFPASNFFHTSWDLTFYSEPCSKTSSVYVLPLMPEINFHIHRKLLNL
jgi:hypothetical protein